MVDKEISYPIIHKQECKGCGRCILGCSQNAIFLSQELNDAGYQYAYYSGSGCTGCKDCFFTCPEPLALEVHSLKRIVKNQIATMIKHKVEKREATND